MRLGSIIVYRGQGPLFRILSFLLSIFESDWRKLSMIFVNGTKGKPWHVAFVCGHDGTEWVVSEAVASGVRCVPLSQSLGYKQGYQVYDWFETPLEEYKVDDFVATHKGQKYDIAIYFWTSLAIIIRHYWNRPIPKLLDRRFSCWELVQDFAEYVGKPIVSKYDVIIITDLLKALTLVPIV